MVNRSPLVSVLLPFHQAGATLASALASIRRQTLPDWHCVLVDDGSNDEGPAIAAAVAAVDRRFEILRLPHGGLVQALNAGLARCPAPLVARMDADDLMHRERLRLQVDSLRARPDLAGVGCHVRLFPRRGMSDGLRQYGAWLASIEDEAAVARERFVESPLVHPTWLMRREVLVDLGYRDSGWPEDYDLLLRVIEGGARLGVVPRRLLCWRDSPARLTRTAAAYALDRHTACKAHFLARGFLAATDRYALWGHGGTGAALRRALRAEGKAPGFIIELHPGRLGQRIDGAPVVHPEELTALPRLPLIASVAGAAPRAEIRAFLQERGFIEERDFVCAA